MSLNGHIEQLGAYFKTRSSDFETCKSDTAIQGIVIPGNQSALDAASKLQKGGLDVRVIRISDCSTRYGAIANHTCIYLTQWKKSINCSIYHE